MTSCNKVKCVLAVILVFAFMVIFEGAVNHSGWMMTLYHETPSLWRAPEDMQNMLPYFLLRTLLLAMAFTCLFKKITKGCNCNCPNCTGTSSDGATACAAKKCCPYARGLCYGSKIGLILGVMMAGSYIWMPISQQLALSWLACGFAEGLGVGLLLSLIYRKKDSVCSK